MRKLLCAAITLGVSLLLSASAWAQAGSLIDIVPLPVESGGVSVGVDCQGTVYWTSTWTIVNNNLFKMDGTGALLGSVPITDSATGAPLLIDEIAWDETRQVLWGQLHDSNPVAVYTINVDTGVATFAWTSATISIGTFRDGIAYDGTDDTIWISGDISSTIEHYNATTGALLGSITPKNAVGGTLGLISGVIVGVGDLLYLGRNGAVEIVQVKKSNGDFIASFASPGGTRDEGLECDATNFPTLALWSREFDPPGEMSVIELEPGTCECGGGGTLTCTQGFWKNHEELWINLDPDAEPAWGDGNSYLEIFGISSKKGDATIILAHALIAAMLNTGAPAADLVSALVLLAAHPVGSGDLEAKKNADPDRAVALALAETLQAFNESADCTLP